MNNNKLYKCLKREQRGPEKGCNWIVMGLMR